MARPVNADAAATRQRILEVAAELLQTTTPAQFSNREVARRADVSVATVNHHFGSKKKLIEACIEMMYEGLDELAGELTRELASGAPLPALLDKAVLLCYRHAREHQAFVRMLIVGIVGAGALDASQRPTFEFRGLDAIAPMLAAALDLDRTEVRLRLKTLLFVASRYAAGTPESRAELVELPPGEAEAAIEQHLLAVVRALLPLKRSTPGDENPEEPIAG